MVLLFTSFEGVQGGLNSLKIEQLRSFIGLFSETGLIWLMLLETLASFLFCDYVIKFLSCRFALHARTFVTY